MKLLIVTVLSLVSSVAMADGFRCQGAHFRVKMYNEVQPAQGTRNPAVLVVYEKGVGTIATLERNDILKTNDQDTVTYEGQTNSRQDGRFVAVRLQVEKQARDSGELEGQHVGTLLVNADGDSREETVACERYLKRQQ